jgi:uncharacterized protein YcbK (DUF882 family)
MSATSPLPHSEGVFAHAEETLARASQSILHTAEIALRLPEPPSSRWHRAGVGARGERIFDIASGLVLVLFAGGWTWSITDARTAEGGGSAVTAATATITSALTSLDAPTAAYLTDATLDAFTPLRGASGRLRARVQQPGEPVDARLPSGAELRFSSGERAESTTALAAPQRSGVWELAIRLGSAIKPITDLSVITLKPFSEKRRGRVGLYYIGSWPGERGRGRGSNYANPSGFIEVTAENQDTQLSEHFRLRDFLTHDQPNVWPKYLVLDMKLVDKLELVLLDLQSRGFDVSGVRVMSGFRTPQYNESGGDPSGRAGLSRHMYGDAADIYIDNDNNGNMDDLNRDRRSTISDARVILASVDRVEQENPTLVGGAGVYAASGGHGPFIHIDTRGYRARWIGTGSD